VPKKLTRHQTHYQLHVTYTVHCDFSEKQ